VQRMLLTGLVVVWAGLVLPAPLPAHPRWHGHMFALPPLPPPPPLCRRHINARCQRTPGLGTPGQAVVPHSLDCVYCGVRSGEHSGPQPQHGPEENTA
jgi:hypothetical protein